MTSPRRHTSPLRSLEPPFGELMKLSVRAARVAAKQPATSTAMSTVDLLVNALDQVLEYPEAYRDDFRAVDYSARILRRALDLQNLEMIQQHAKGLHEAAVAFGRPVAVDGPTASRPVRSSKRRNPAVGADDAVSAPDGVDVEVGRDQFTGRMQLVVRGSAPSVRAAAAFPDVPALVTTTNQLMPLLRGVGTRYIYQLPNSETLQWFQRLHRSLVEPANVQPAQDGRSIASEWARFRDAVGALGRRSGSQGSVMEAAKELTVAIKQTGIEQLIDPQVSAALTPPPVGSRRTRVTRRRSWIAVVGAGPSVDDQQLTSGQSRIPKPGQAVPPMTRPRLEAQQAAGVAARSTSPFWGAFPGTGRERSSFLTSGGTPIYPRAANPIRTARQLRQVVESVTPIQALPLDCQKQWADRVHGVLPRIGLVEKFDESRTLAARVFDFRNAVSHLARHGESSDLAGAADGLRDALEASGLQDDESFLVRGAVLSDNSVSL